MKYGLLFVFLCLSGFCFGEENKAYLSDGKIVVKPAEAPVLAQPAVSGETASSSEPAPSAYNLKNWDVSEQVNPVAEALKVYKSKGEDLYTRQVYIYDKTRKHQRIYIEYTNRKNNDKVIFSPNEDYVYYRDFSDGGEGVIYGVNLLNNRRFAVDRGEDFEFFNYGPGKDYILVKKGSDRLRYYVLYGLDGKQERIIHYGGSFEDVKKQIRW